MKLISSSRHVICESIASKWSPMKAQRSHSLVRTSCNKEDEVYHYGGGEGVRSSGMGGGRSCLRTHWPSISFQYPKEVVAQAPIENDLLTLTKGSSYKGTLKCWRNKVTRWVYGRGALAHNALCIWYLTRWAQSIWRSIWRPHSKIKSSLEAWARLVDLGSKTRQRI